MRGKETIAVANMAEYHVMVILKPKRSRTFDPTAPSGRSSLKEKPHNGGRKDHRKSQQTVKYAFDHARGFCNIVGSKNSEEKGEESRYSGYPERIIKWKEIHYLSWRGMLNPTFLNIPALSGPFKNFTNSLAVFSFFVPLISAAG